MAIMPLFFALLPIVESICEIRGGDSFRIASDPEVQALEWEGWQKIALHGNKWNKALTVFFFHTMLGSALNGIFTLSYCLKIIQNVALELQDVKNSLNWTIFGVYNELLFTQNVIELASLAILNETFSVIFKHCVCYVDGCDSFLVNFY